MDVGGLSLHTITLVSCLDTSDLLNRHDRSIKDPGNVFSRYVEQPGHAFTVQTRCDTPTHQILYSWRSFPVPRYTLKGLEELTELKWPG